MQMRYNGISLAQSFDFFGCVPVIVVNNGIVDAVLAFPDPYFIFFKTDVIGSICKRVTQ